MRHSPFHKLKPAQCSDLSLAEDEYRPDFDTTDRYQGFSAELLRLALLSIAGYGFLLTNVVFAGQGAPRLALLSGRSLGVMYVGIGALGFAAGAALLHRFYSTDCLSHQVTLLRLLKRRGAGEWPADVGPELNARFAKELRSQEKNLFASRNFLVASSVALWLGAAALALSLGMALKKAGKQAEAQAIEASAKAPNAGA